MASAFVCWFSWRHTMEVLALTPALGADGATLVGLALRALNRLSAPTALQAAWRGHRERRRRPDSVLLAMWGARVVRQNGTWKIIWDVTRTVHVA
eukprot:7385955-Prymnesium_polylepis.1